MQERPTAIRRHRQQGAAFPRATDRHPLVPPRLKVNPPLRTGDDAQATLDAIARGTVGVISTDHAPRTPEEKADEATVPPGIPSIDWHLPLVLELVEEGRLDWPHAQLPARRPAPMA